MDCEEFESQLLSDLQIYGFYFVVFKDDGTKVRIPPEDVFVTGRRDGRLLSQLLALG